MPRLKPTPFDYLVIAVNPALIMVLIGSVVYFLLELYYQGQYPERLHFCLTMFVFSAVLIARISMEDGWEHAAPFGVALGVAICAAMHRFVSYKGSQLETVGWLINYGLIALTAFCAYKLTWDCTLMDETEDASGEGLLQTAGLDSPSDASDQHGSESAKQSTAAPGDPISDTAPLASEILEEDREAHASKSPFKRFIRYLERHFRRPRRPHAAGLWVVYFSLVALPLFGLGQASIPTEKTTSRQYTFALVCIYVAAALGLLLTTSFLGLRKYLRQRRLEMPATMAGTWLATGVALIAVMICFTALLPRTNAEYEFSQLPSQLTSEKHDSSKISAGNEGVRDEKAKSARGDSNQPQDKNSQQKSDSTGDSKSADKSAGKQSSQSDNSKSGESKSDSKSQSGKSGDSKSSDSQSSQSNSSQSKSDSSKSSDSKSSQSKSNSSSDSKSSGSKSDQSKSSDSKSDSSNSDQGKIKAPKPAESKSDKSANGSSKPQNSPPDSKSWQPPGTPPPPNFLLAAQWVGDLLKFAFYGLLAGLFIWWLIFHWRTVLDWIASLVNGWQNLWGLRRPKDVSLEEYRARPKHKRFADFSDPFASGVAGRYPIVELVRYTFEALEAWARDNGLPREPDQTAHEFARQIAMQIEPLAAPARTLADLYSRAAYAPKTLPASTADDLHEFWQLLLRVEASRFAAPV